MPPARSGALTHHDAQRAGVAAYGHRGEWILRAVPWGVIVNLEKVIFGFFILLAATLNFGFFIGDISAVELHNQYELFGALIVSLIATVLKFGDRTQIGAVHLATSLVADLQLACAALVWGYAAHVSAEGVTPFAMASVVSLSGGALLANLVSVVLLVIETVSFHRR